MNQNKTYKLVVAINEVNGLTDVEYHSSSIAANSRKEYWTSKGYATMIIEENKHLELKVNSHQFSKQLYSKIG